MKITEKIYAALLGIALLCTPSCQVNELLTKDIEVQQLSAEEENRVLIEKARNGEAEALHELALRHRDGIGTPQNIMSAFIYQGIFCSKSGEIDTSSMNIFEEGTAAHIFTLMLENPSDAPFMQQKLDELADVCPLEAEAFSILSNMNKDIDYTDGIRRLEELEKEGSILAVLMQVMYFEETRDDTRYEAILKRACEKQPFYHALLGEFYERKYNGIEDLHWVEKAKEHYQEADRYALLTPRFARHYYQLLEHFNKENLIPCSPEEICRIKRMAGAKDVATDNNNREE